jgi:polysaccharide biosynthesis/export protein
MNTLTKLTNTSQPVRQTVRALTEAALLLLLLLGISGCHSPQAVGNLSSAEMPTPGAEAGKSEVIVLHEGDSVRISFPGAPNLNSVQQIRRDGRITLALIGEFQAAGLTPPAMEKELLKLYGPQLQTKEVNVAVESSAFPIYVTGAVLRPGRINADRPLTALEAVMEAGIDYNRANLKSVRVIRNENGQTKHHTLNLKKILDGGTDDQFKLRPQDILFVPERFNWF